MAARTRKTSQTAAQDAQAEVKTAQDKPEVKPVPKEVDVHQYIPVRNGFQGTLVYKSKKTGETFVWSGFGETQDMELQELKSAKSASKVFFQNNWFMFDEEYMWVVDYLGLGAFYRNALRLDQFDELFTKKPDEIKKIVGGLSNGQKTSVDYRARQLISEGGIDSNRAITALEEALGVQLVEK